MREPEELLSPTSLIKATLDDISTKALRTQPITSTNIIDSTEATSEDQGVVREDVSRHEAKRGVEKAHGGRRVRRALGEPFPQPLLSSLDTGCNSERPEETEMSATESFPTATLPSTASELS